jgi:hypothetical protein
MSQDIRQSMPSNMACQLPLTVTPSLDQEERRKRVIIYMFRYNRLEKWMVACISDSNLPKKVFMAECAYYEGVRKDIQAQAIGNALSDESAGSPLKSQPNLRSPPEHP